MIQDKWEKVQLGEPDVSVILMGQSPSSTTYNTVKEGLPFYQGKVDFGYVNPTPRIWCNEPLRIANRGDILMSVRAPVGDVNITNEKCCIGRGIAAIRGLNKANTKFLFYRLQFVKSELEKVATGATFQAISKGDLYDLEIDLPPLPEQKHIAYVLSKLQEAVSIQEQLLKTLQELKRTLLQKMFQEGLCNEPTKQTEIGEIPESWELISIGELGQVVTGNTPPTEDKDSYGFGYPFITPGDIDEHRMIDVTARSLTLKGTTKSRPLPTNSVCVVCIGSTIGKVGMVKIENSCTNQQINSIICNDENNPSFIYQLMKFNANRIRNYSTPSPVPIISKGSFERILIATTRNSVDQEQIANILNAIDDRSVVAQNEKQIRQELFETMLQKLMSGDIRVNDLQLPEDETEGIIEEVAPTIYCTERGKV